MDEAIAVVGMDHEAGGAVVDDRSSPGHIGGHDGNAGQRRLDEDARQALALRAAGEAEHVGVGEQLVDVVASAEQFDPAGVAPRPEFGHERPVADDPCRDVVSSLAHLLDDVDEPVGTLRGGEVADEGHHGPNRINPTVSRPVSIRVASVGDEHQAFSRYVEDLGRLVEGLLGHAGDHRGPTERQAVHLTPESGVHVGRRDADAIVDERAAPGQRRNRVEKRLTPVGHDDIRSSPTQGPPKPPGHAWVVARSPQPALGDVERDVGFEDPRPAAEQQDEPVSPRPPIEAPPELVRVDLCATRHVSGDHVDDGELIMALRFRGCHRSDRSSRGRVYRRPMAKRQLLQAVKAISSALDIVRRPSRGITVLMYHRVGGGSGLEIDLEPERFAAQMAAIADRAISLDEAVEWLGRPAPEGPDPVVVTFDDGTADVIDHALPILVEHRVPATLYVATDFVESRRPFPDDGHPASWRGLSDGVSTGLLTLGSHTHTHALLDRIPPAAVRDELDRSIDLLGERVGVRADHFAYPKAVVGTTDAEAAVSERFRTAAVGGGRPNPYEATDLQHLTRSAIQVADGMRWFERKADGGMAFEEVLRGALNRRRYVGATS